MRILQLIQKKQYRGAEIFSCQLSNHLLEKGHDVIVVSIYEGEAQLPFLLEIESIDRPESQRYHDFVGWKMLAGIVKEFCPDIVQANAADTLKYAVLSKTIFQWTSPLIFRNASSSSYYVKNWLSRRINSFLLKRVDMIVSVSHASKIDINRIFPFTKKKSLVITVGLENNILLSHPANMYIKDGKKNIIHVGSFTKEKNHVGLIRIFKQLSRYRSDLILHLIGSGPSKSSIQKLVEREGLKSKVIFHKENNNPLPYIKEADILVLPSLVEGLPGVILEAMYCRTPVVAYDVGGISEVLTSETGYLVKKSNEKDFIRAVLEGLENLDKEKIDKANLLVHEKFMNNKIAEQFIEVYSHLKSS